MLPFPCHYSYNVILVNKYDELTHTQQCKGRGNFDPICESVLSRERYVLWADRWGKGDGETAFIPFSGSSLIPGRTVPKTRSSIQNCLRPLQIAAWSCSSPGSPHPGLFTHRARAGWDACSSFPGPCPLDRRWKAPSRPLILTTQCLQRSQIPSAI